MTIFRRDVLLVILLLTGLRQPVVASLVVVDSGGTLEWSSDARIWQPATNGFVIGSNVFVRTPQLGRATVKLNDLTDLRLGPESEMQFLPAATSGANPVLSFLAGSFFFFSRDEPRSWPFQTPTATGTNIGTAFGVQVERRSGRTVASVLEGRLTIAAAGATIPVGANQEARVVLNAPPEGPVSIQAANVVQWWLFYPAVLDPDAFNFTPAERETLQPSVAAFRRGNVLTALRLWPGRFAAVSDDAHLYYAGLLLAAGAVTNAENHLQVNKVPEPLSLALRRLISAVREPTNQIAWPESATAAEHLGQSYFEQSRSSRPEALARARQHASTATELNPRFGLAWARLAELDFSHGELRVAQQHLDRALQLAPENPQAHALHGFLLAAAGEITRALEAFDHAIALDGSLGNAWLGKGLCLLRQRRSIEGRRALLTAASHEPNRSLLRSYLGKAYADAGDARRAAEELDIARKWDPNDPTVWLYSALLHHQSFRINEAIHDLEHSRALNDNRAVYRSRLMLDQDQAVRSANLAAIYRDAGMFDVSVREASKAVSSDYANYSAHLFLANSYAELGDPNLVGLRYETATFNEYLIANLLSPVAAGTLSRSVSQQEYSRFFERDRFGGSLSTTYLSNGDWQQEASQFGTVDGTGYALDAVYRSFNGQRRNNELEQWVASAQLKQQITPEDTAYFQAIYNDFESGDLKQYYRPEESSPTLEVKEEQEPNLLAGYHHEWSPGVHTLFLGARLSDTLRLHEPFASLLNLYKNNSGDVVEIPEDPDIFDLRYKNRLLAYSAELQQIWQNPSHVVIAGARFQNGDVNTRNLLLYRGPRPSTAVETLTNYKNTGRLARLNGYAYHNWRIIDPFWLFAGVTYDQLDYPANASAPPVSRHQDEKTQVSPKAGFAWNPKDATSVRGAYTRSLGGLFYDQSVRLEPSQVAGFNQAFRSLFPDSIVGPVPGSEFESVHFGIDHRFLNRTYVYLEGALLKAEAERSIGVFEYFQSAPGFPPASATQTPQDLEFHEKSLTLALHQLLGENWAFGFRYRVSDAELESRLPAVPPALLPKAHHHALLHQVRLFAIYNHPSGFFASIEPLWWGQSNLDDSSYLANDSFWQLNVRAGYRFPRRRAEIAFGLLNLTDEDYRLNPVNLYGELPRERTLAAHFKFYF